MEQKISFIDNIDFSKEYAAALCLRIMPEDAVFSECSGYTELIHKKLSVFDTVSELFREEKYGFEYDRSENEIRLICTIPVSYRESCAEMIIKPLLIRIEKILSCSFICGIGLLSANRLHINESLQTSREACDLFFFEKGRFFEYQKMKRPYSISMEEYEQLSEKAFKAILAKQPSALEDISDCLELIRNIHYGNKQAVIMRAMNYTGEMAYRLHRYDLLGGDFYKIQDALQEKVLSSETFLQLKNTILDYYRVLLAEINSKSRTGRKTITEQIKKYIQENYMEDLTVNELSSIACVSPGYFSHMFKNETGQSFKSYLTDTRMKAAATLLLSSDLRLYEISEKVGYNNVRNFTDAFSKKYGVSPSKYKQDYYKH